MFHDEPRPIILWLENFKGKTDIISNGKRLKGTNFFINYDYSRRVRTIPQNLWRSFIKCRAKGDKVFLVFDKLIINGGVYTWDEQKLILHEHVQRSFQPWGAWQRRDENGKAFSITILNPRSIGSKTIHLENILVEYDPSVAIITEMFFVPSIFDCEVVPPGYGTVMKDWEGRGGGAPVIINNCIDCVAIEDTPDFECV